MKVYGPLWSVPGKYSLVAQYGFKHISAIVNFQFEQEDVPTQNVFNVKDLSSGQNFDLNYTITGGQVENMVLDKQNIALVVQINSTDSGMLHLQIPRLLLDSKKSSNADESFLVFINDDEITSFQQTSSDYNYRVLDIPIVTGDSKIEIIGTTVIPEFENISSLILVLAVGLMIIFSVLLQTRMNPKSLEFVTSSLILFFSKISSVFHDLLLYIAQHFLQPSLQFFYSVNFLLLLHHFVQVIVFP